MEFSTTKTSDKIALPLTIQLSCNWSAGNWERAFTKLSRNPASRLSAFRSLFKVHHKFFWFFFNFCLVVFIFIWTEILCSKILAFLLCKALNLCAIITVNLTNQDIRILFASLSFCINEWKKRKSKSLNTQTRSGTCIKSYLEEWQYKVIFRSSVSDPIKSTFGIPQSSHFGPSIFTLTMMLTLSSSTLMSLKSSGWFSPTVRWLAQIFNPVATKIRSELSFSIGICKADQILFERKPI